MAWEKANKTKLTTILAAVLLTMSVVLAGTPAQAKKKAIELSFASHFNPSNAIYVHVLKPWAKELERRTNGRYKVQFYLAQSLAKAKNEYNAVVNGVADMSWGLHGFNPGRFPLISVMHLPFLSPSTTAGTKAFLDLYNQTPAMQKEHDDVHIIYLFASLPVEIHTIKKPVRTLEDLKDMKLACQPGSTAAVGALGAVPVPMPPAKWYPSLQKGVVDGIAVAYGAFDAFKLQDVTKYHTNAHMGSVTAWCAMNKNVWNSLPTNVQNIINEISKDLPQMTCKAVTDDQTKVLKELAARGQEIIELSPEERARWMKATRPVYEEWVKRMEARGLPGKEVLDTAEKLIKKYSK